ncbi:unnamed protein product [Auanema sp. JU1783]|nr:unnamed protein product [Auanema sp. JU1783]
MKLTTLPEVLNFYSLKKQYENVCFENPFGTEIGKGCSHFVLSHSAFKKECDLTVDSFSPWTGKGYNTKRVTTKSIFVNLNYENGVYSKTSQQTKYKLKIIKNNHVSLEGLKRSIYCFYREDVIVEPILYVYESLALQYSDRTIEELPSDRVLFKKALEHRTTTAARTYLKELGYKTTNRQLTSLSRSVPTHIKTKKGFQTPLDIQKILDRYVAKADSQEILARPVIERDGDCLKVRIMVCYPIAIKCFGAGLPMRLELHEHAQDLRNVMKGSDAEIMDFFQKILSTTTPSGNIPCIGSSIMVDTTFSLSSSEYVTIMLGVNDIFRSKLSKKNQSVILGIMIHTRKGYEDHEDFANFMNNNLTKFASTKSVGLLIHDGEMSFKAYNTGTFLKDAVLLRCDAHRLENIREALRKDPQLDFEELKYKLYGKKQQFQGLSVLRKGILQNLRKDVFDTEFDDLMDDLEDGYFKKWMKSNKESFFSHNSMYFKLLGGWPQQFLTTNIIESRNCSIKGIVSHRKPAEKLLEDFLNLHKDEMNERLLCVSGKISKLESDASFTFMEWTGLTIAQRRNLLHSFGLDDLLPPNILENIPLFLLPSKKIDQEQYCKTGEKLAVFNLDENFFVLNVEDKSE